MLSSRKRGPKPRGKVSTEWSADLAYTIGLIATDGNLSKDGRHISLVSKDIEQIECFKKALKLSNLIAVCTSIRGARYYKIQFGDVLFYNFLYSIGLHQNKSKTISTILVPPEFFPDFVRGNLDGDGCVYSCFDIRWKASLLVNTSFVSASLRYVIWLCNEIEKKFDIKGNISIGKKAESIWYQLRYSKYDSVILWNNLYYSPDVLCLNRKKLKIANILDMMCKPLIGRLISTINARVAKLADATP